MLSNNNLHRFTVFFVLLLPLDLSFCAESPNGAFPFAYKHVVIRNDMISSRATLSVHCRYKGKDLGLVKIPYDSSWGFKFHVNFFKTTRYRCHFTWPGQSKWFDVFKVSRDDTVGGPWPVCRECIWSVDGDTFGGPCRIRRDGKPPFCFGWDGKP
ncbi:PREDICTED: uncharacterized protein LOC104820286 [Tarenaya hassleriana]|uniref:uncharacterized protein LOC104820286 n=1 Tax=Tarenaya hassleriana TaxID=28532 RepID=UPI00053C098F|nr:PREDICTED: uncharacterized protein LOC104820286 [Tarenaya hassleriana]